MRNLLTLFQLTMMMGLLSAQTSRLDPVVYQGPLVNKVKDRFIVNEAIGADQDYFYFQAWSGHNQYLMNVIGYDLGDRLGRIKMDDLSASVVKIELNGGDKEERFEFAVLRNDRIYVVTLKYVLNPTKLQYYIRPFGKESLRPIGEQKLLFEVAKDPLINYHRTRIGYRTSPDQSKTMIYAALISQAPSSESFDFVVLDAEMNKEYEHHRYDPAVPEAFTMLDCGIQNDGTALFLGKTRSIVEPNVSWQAKNVDAKQHEYVLAIIHKDGELRKLDVGSEIGPALSIGMIQNQGDVWISGCYTEPGERSIGGFFSSKIERENLLVSQRGFSPIDKTGLQEANPETNVKTSIFDYACVDKYGCNYFSQRMIPAEDGGFWIAVQRCNRNAALSRPNWGFAGSSLLYLYGESYFVRYSGKGDITWAREFKMLQNLNAAGNNFQSYFIGSKNNNLFFIFNDVDSKDAKFPVAFKSFPVKMGIFDPIGNYNERVLFDTDEIKIDPLSRLGNMYLERSVLLFGQGGGNAKRYRFIRIDI